MSRWRRFVDWLLEEPDPDIFNESVIPPDPPVEDPHVRVARASAALRAAQAEMVQAVAGLHVRRIDR